ncbi:MAG: hypothetical protein ACRC2T_08035 [Thermoguttaceae bacterium]
MKLVLGLRKQAFFFIRFLKIQPLVVQFVDVRLGHREYQYSENQMVDYGLKNKVVLISVHKL